MSPSDTAPLPIPGMFRYGYFFFVFQYSDYRFYGPNGLKKFLITNETDLELLLMNNRVYSGELAKNLSSRKRERIVQRAKELNVRLTNAKAKVATEEKQTKE